MIILQVPCPGYTQKGVPELRNCNCPFKYPFNVISIKKGSLHAMLQPRWLVTGFLPRWPRFDSRSSHLASVDNAALGAGFL
jgi:hypothetical protein